VIVCIDPGHGGPDPGAVNPILGLREKDVTLEVSKRLAEYLTRAGVQVVLTRDKDTDLAPGLNDEAEMRARAKVANDAKADYLVSVHANSASDPEANGIEVSHWPGSVKGEALAKSILEALHIAGGLQKRRVCPQNLLLHAYGNMVTVTVEIGFVSNRVDGALIGQAAWRDKIALGVAFGILAMRA
jgi:N-acetylmuramoyl-L-alanine amidase